MDASATFCQALFRSQATSAQLGRLVPTLPRPNPVTGICLNRQRTRKLKPAFKSERDSAEEPPDVLFASASEIPRHAPSVV